MTTGGKIRLARECLLGTGTKMRVFWLMSAVLLWTSGCFEKTPNPKTAGNANAPSASATSNQLTIADRDGIRFQEFTRETGIRFTYQNDEEQGQLAIIESMGGGLAIFDFDQDGLLDILMPGGGRYHAKQVGGLPSALYRNQGNWRFTDVTQPALIGRSEHYSHGAAVGDVNEGGFSDVLVTGYGVAFLPNAASLKTLYSQRIYDYGLIRNYAQV